MHAMRASVLENGIKQRDWLRRTMQGKRREGKKEKGTKHITFLKKRVVLYGTVVCLGNANH